MRDIEISLQGVSESNFDPTSKRKSIRFWSQRNDRMWIPPKQYYGTIKTPSQAFTLSSETLGPMDQKSQAQHPHFWTKIRSKNWSKIANICRNWTKLGQNPVELIVLETLGGIPEPNLNQNVSKNSKKNNKLRTLTPWEYMARAYMTYWLYDWNIPK